MTWYWLLFVLVLILLSINNGQKSQWSLLISLSLIFLFFAFREGFTPDYEAYLFDFEGNSGESMQTEGHHRRELIYQLMRIYLPYRLALIIQTLFVCVAIYLTFKHIPRKFWWFSVIILFLPRFFLLGNMGAFRSSFVTAFFLFALILRERYGQKKGTVWGVILLSVSALIHSSAWIMIALYLLIGDKPLTLEKRKIWIIVSVILVILSMFFGNSLNNLLNYFFSDIEGFEYYRIEEINNVMKVGSFTVFYLFMLLYLLFYTLKFFGETGFTKLETNCIKLTAVFLLIVLLPGIGLKERFYYYLAIPSLIGATTIINKDKTTMGFIYCGLWLIFAMWNLYLFLNSPVYPIYSRYHNILFQ